MIKKIYDPTEKSKVVSRLCEPYTISDEEPQAEELPEEDQYKIGDVPAENPYRITASTGVAGMTEGVQKR